MTKKALLFILSFCLYQSALACTTILVTKGATEDGSTILASTDDGDLGDPRIIYVPAEDYKPKSTRPIYPYRRQYPRYVGKNRGPGYELNGYKPTKPIGYIDQIPHTYARIDYMDGILNEKQIAV